jgi:hypothetical protein
LAWLTSLHVPGMGSMHCLLLSYLLGTFSLCLSLGMSIRLCLRMSMGLSMSLRLSPSLGMSLCLCLRLRLCMHVHHCLWLSSATTHVVCT